MLLYIVWCIFWICLNLLEFMVCVLFSICSFFLITVMVNGVFLEMWCVICKVKFFSFFIFIIWLRMLIVSVCWVVIGEVVKISFLIMWKFVLWVRLWMLIRLYGMLRFIGVIEKVEVLVVMIRLEFMIILNVLF